MSSVLIVKLGAAGDVVRTTTILHLFKDKNVDWLVSEENKDLLPTSYLQNVFTNPDQLREGSTYDSVLNLEDDTEVTRKVFARIEAAEIFGAYIRPGGEIAYTENSAEWFDMSLISRFGLDKANELKLANRSSYQEIIFRSLGCTFNGQRYILPHPLPDSDLTGDIAVAPVAGKRWPMKNWFYFDELINLLSRNFRVNVLPLRPTLLEHCADISNHRLVICNDSLPMHLALGLGLPAVSFFTCTSPWEIYDYGLLTKLVSPKLSDYFYQRKYATDAVKAISLKAAYDATLKGLVIYERNWAAQK